MAMGPGPLWTTGEVWLVTFLSGLVGVVIGVFLTRWAMGPDARPPAGPDDDDRFDGRRY